MSDLFCLGLDEHWGRVHVDNDLVNLFLRTACSSCAAILEISWTTKSMSALARSTTFLDQRLGSRRNQCVDRPEGEPKVARIFGYLQRVFRKTFGTPLGGTLVGPLNSR